MGPTPDLEAGDDEPTDPPLAQDTLPVMTA